MGISKVCNLIDCTGCGMCAQICGKGAISMSPDEEGFMRPEIDKAKCVECGLCQKLCPVNTPLSGKKYKPVKIFSGWSNDEATRMNSSSGGAFTEIAKIVLAEGGVVFGAAMDENVIVRHTHTDSMQGLMLLQGSKYVQSDIGDAYKETLHFLEKGRHVLFSGTPCQIAGLRNFLRKDYGNLTTVDLVCHGVPSPLIFEDYKKYVECIIRERITTVKFRCKKSSWIFFNMGINPHVEKNGSVKYSYIGNYYSDPYIRVFLRDYILRPNCHTCKYASIGRVSDFTIADWWGYKATSPEDKDFDKKGVSLVMCNTEKAVAMSKRLDMRLKERTEQEALRTNPALHKPFPMSKTRSEFWNDYRTKPFEYMVKKWMQPEKIVLSRWVSIYCNSKALKFCANLYEKVMRKAHLNNLLIYVKAK